MFFNKALRSKNATLSTYEKRVTRYFNRGAKVEVVFDRLHIHNKHEPSKFKKFVGSGNCNTTTTKVFDQVSVLMFYHKKLIRRKN